MLGSTVTNPVGTDFVGHDCDSGRKLVSGGTHEALGSLIQGGLLDGRNQRLYGKSNQQLRVAKEAAGITSSM